MDGMIRALERKRAGGDVDAAIRLGRIRDRFRKILAPCITLCPVGIGSVGDGWPPYNGYPQKSMRGEYVSILFTLGRWQDAPVVAIRFGCDIQLSNDFFLRTLTKKTTKKTPRRSP